VKRIPGNEEIIVCRRILPAVRILSGRTAGWTRVAAVAAVALVYFAAARFGLGFAVVAEQVTVVWPPSGIALAALLVLGFQAWPGVWIGALAANLLAHEGFGTALAIASGNTMEALAGAWLLRRVRFHERLDRIWDVMGLLGLAAGLSTTVSATVGATSLCLSGIQPWSAFASLWSVWWLGDAMGILLFSPALLIWGSRPRLRLSRRRVGEAIALAACVVIGGQAIFGGKLAHLTGRNLAYLVFPLLIWAALRFGQRGAAPAILLVTGIAVADTVRGLGPFGSDAAAHPLLMLQVFLAVAALTTLVLGAAIAERDTADRRRTAEYIVAGVMARSATLEEAAPRMLEGLCEGLEWDLGALWVVDDARHELRCLALWHGPELTAPEFVAETRQRRFPPGLGLPGRVWQTGEPVWISDVVHDANFPRAPFARREGLHSAFGFPISVSGRFLGLMEFFSREIRRPEEALLQLFTIVGSQIGQFIVRTRSEAAARASEAELRQASEAKDQFLALLGHELRNPLAPIRNALEILSAGKTSPSVATQMHEMMQRQTAHMVRLVDDLLDVSRITRGKIELRREQVDLGTAVERVIDTVRPLIDDRGHDLRVSLPSEPIVIEADPTRLEQILSNLLSNAAKYTPGSGTIDFSVARDHDQAVIRVRDSGIGIRPEMLGHIFELFAQADRLPERVQEGLGIGLTLVRSLAQLHGGTVTAASAGPGRGSEFIVRLPCLPPHTPLRPPASKAPADTARAQPRRVLVVDDNADSAESLGILLQMQGHDVRLAHDGPSALAAAREHRPELVLLDIGLPAGMDGYEVAQRLRPEAGLERAVIVAVTGFGQQEDRQRAADAGFDDHLVKPVDIQKLWRLLAGL
jgi:signal transduction histidine kinase/integral membrane sensor domain MASE1/CheY-like chemotaxis protein